MWAQVPYAPDSSPPSPRYGHTAVVLAAACTYLAVSTRTALRAMSSLSIASVRDLASRGAKSNVWFADTSRWKLLKPQGGVTPRDAYYHTAVVYQVRILRPIPSLYRHSSVPAGLNVCVWRVQARLESTLGVSLWCAPCFPRTLIEA